jgi:hypothetical protein
MANSCCTLKIMLLKRIETFFIATCEIKHIIKFQISAVGTLHQGNQIQKSLFLPFYGTVYTYLHDKLHTSTTVGKNKNTRNPDWKTRSMLLSPKGFLSQHPDSWDHLIIHQQAPLIREYLVNKSSLLLKINEQFLRSRQSMAQTTRAFPYS